ncbi:MAG: hypothetical protein NWR72_08085 [Bacteroidia bacterium]|nr:hypothetical protein [Bacteroidia bacterium]
MLGFWEWILIVLLMSWIVVPWVNRKRNNSKPVKISREGKKEEPKPSTKAREVPYTPEN